MGVYRTKQDLLEHSGVKRWYYSLSRGSRITADVYVRRLRQFCDENGVSPDDLIRMARDIDSVELEDLVDDHISRLEKEGKAGSYVEGVVKVVRSWLHHNAVGLKRKMKIKNASATPTIEHERTPEKDELRYILNSATPRSRATKGLISQAGLRP